MAIKLGKYQMKGFTSWMGLTKRNHISTLFGEKPQKASETMVQLMAFRTRPSIESFLTKFPVKEFNDDSEFYWDIVGSAKRNIPLVEARDLEGNQVTNGMVGVNVEPFYLVFAENYFADGEVIFGNYNQVYPMRVLGDARPEGTNYVIKVELMGGITTGIPAERLQRGEKFSVGFAPVERELSRKVGDIRFSSPVAMRNEWTTIRIQHKVPGSMLDKKLAVGLPVVRETPDGRISTDTVTTWMHNVDWTLEQQWRDYKNMAIAWGTSNRNSNGEYLNIGKSGEVIRMGDGLFAQMEAANNIYYNTFSLKLIENALYDLIAGKLDVNDRVFVLRTGMKGAELFSKAVGETVSGWKLFNFNGDALGVVSKAQSPLHANSLKAGYQFTEYLAPNGMVLKVEVDPFYDDAVINKVQHPLGGPASSYRFDILDIGSAEEQNIFMCKIKGQDEVRGIQPGLRDPFTGNANVNFMSHDEDSSIIHKMTTLGVCVLDPTRTMSIIPAILQG